MRSFFSGSIGTVGRLKCSSAAILLVLMVLLIRADGLGHREIGRMSGIPNLVLWAWERPEDLRFIHPENTAVAFLANTILLRSGETVALPRFQPLHVPDRAKLIAVTRIQVEPGAELNAAQIAGVVSAIAKASALPRVVAVQVDFDATVSQRGFYRDVLVALRRRLGPAEPISITALASWCLGDNWISGLPIDEAVPMLFRMGAETNEVVAQMSAGHDFRPAVCRGGLGISTDERWQSLPGARRLYAFNPKSWTEGEELAVRREVRQWR